MRSSAMKRWISLMVAAALLLTLFSACGLFGGSDKALIINEVMTSNKRTLADGDGDYSDWIELYNNTDKDINLKGYHLSDNIYNTGKWTFPEVTIGAGEYLVVFASGKDKLEEDGKTCHMSFKLSSKGETIVLSSPSASAVDTLEVPALDADVSYGRVEEGEEKGSYGIMLAPSPGKINGGKRAEAPNVTLDPSGSMEGTGEILINEYMSRNSYICYDEDGDYSDWVELYNTTDAPVNLTGYYMTTDPTNLQKWSFPNVTIEAKGYLLVWLSGKNKVTDKGEIHANFKLGAKDKQMILASSAATVIDHITVEHLPGNISHGRSASDPNKWVYFARPTPGKPNTTPEFTELSAANSLKARGLWISEVSSVSLPYNDREVSDWIEIYNGTGEAVNLKGYGLSIDKKDRFSYQFGEKTIAAGAYLVIYATGPKVPATFVSKLHTNTFKLSAKGETIYLTDPEGVTIDAFETGRLSDGYTSGRIGTDAPTRYFFTTATPGAANSSDGKASYAPKPEISNAGGYVNAGTEISITVPAGTEVYYTTDGSEPTLNAKKYSGSILIQKNTVIKAKAMQNELLPSDTVSATYFIEKNHTVPIVSLLINPDDFMGNQNGLYAKGPGFQDVFPYTGANFWKDWERKVTFEYYSPQGEKQVEFISGIKIFGQYSRGYAQKSMSIHMRGDYGMGSVTYPFFKDNPITTMSNMVLRAAGQDYKGTRIRDAFCAQVMKGQTSLVLMDWQPVVVYVNGEYFGFYGMREKINANYLQSHLGIDKNNVDIIKGNKMVLEGSYDNHAQLLEYVKTHDLSKAENYKVVDAWVDIDNFIDYLITEIYFSNGDTGNVKFYRERKEGAKWQWVMFDFDMGLRNEIKNSIAYMFNPKGHGHNNAFYTTLQCGLLKNETFKQKFIDRYAYHINHTFQPERMLQILDGMVKQFEGEIESQVTRWGAPTSYNEWVAQVNSLKNIIKKRPAEAKAEFQAFFGFSDAKMKELFPTG